MNGQIIPFVQAALEEIRPPDEHGQSMPNPPPWVGELAAAVGVRLTKIPPNRLRNGDLEREVRDLVVAYGVGWGRAVDAGARGWAGRWPRAVAAIRKMVEDWVCRSRTQLTNVWQIGGLEFSMDPGGEADLLMTLLLEGSCPCHRKRQEMEVAFAEKFSTGCIRSLGDLAGRLGKKQNRVVAFIWDGWSKRCPEICRQIEDFNNGIRSAFSRWVLRKALVDELNRVIEGPLLNENLFASVALPKHTQDFLTQHQSDFAGQRIVSVARLNRALLEAAFGDAFYQRTAPLPEIKPTKRCRDQHALASWDPSECNLKDFVAQAVKGERTKAQEFVPGMFAGSMYFYHLFGTAFLRCEDVWVWSHACIGPTDGETTKAGDICPDCSAKFDPAIHRGREERSQLFIPFSHGGTHELRAYWSCRPPATVELAGIVDPSYLARMLKHRKDPISKQIRDSLVKVGSISAQLDTWAESVPVPAPLVEALVKGLNAIIKGDSIWNNSTFGRLPGLRATTRDQAQRLEKKENPTPGEIERHNRQLLEEAFTLSKLGADWDCGNLFAEDFEQCPLSVCGTPLGWTARPTSLWRFVGRWQATVEPGEDRDPDQILEELGARCALDRSTSNNEDTIVAAFLMHDVTRVFCERYDGRMAQTHLLELLRLLGSTPIHLTGGATPLNHLAAASLRVKDAFPAPPAPGAPDASPVLELAAKRVRAVWLSHFDGLLPDQIAETLQMQQKEVLELLRDLRTWMGASAPSHLKLTKTDSI